jgi:hypothetical protein
MAASSCMCGGRGNVDCACEQGRVDQVQSVVDALEIAAVSIAFVHETKRDTTLILPSSGAVSRIPAITSAVRFQLSAAVWRRRLPAAVSRSYLALRLFTDSPNSLAIPPFQAVRRGIQGTLLNLQALF